LENGWMIYLMEKEYKRHHSMYMKVILFKEKKKDLAISKLVKKYNMKDNLVTINLRVKEN
jgi:hypothetical protein